MARVMTKTGTRTITLNAGVSTPIPSMPYASDAQEFFGWTSDGDLTQDYHDIYIPTTDYLDWGTVETPIPASTTYTGYCQQYGSSRIWGFRCGGLSSDIARQYVSNTYPPDNTETLTSADLTFFSSDAYDITSPDGIRIANLSSAPASGIFTEFDRAYWIDSDTISSTNYNLLITTFLNVATPPTLEYSFASDGHYPLPARAPSTTLYRWMAHFKSYDDEAATYPFCTVSLNLPTANDYTSTQINMVKWYPTTDKSVADAHTNYIEEQITLSDSTDQTRMTRTGVNAAAVGGIFGLHPAPYGMVFIETYVSGTVYRYALDFKSNTYEEIELKYFDASPVNPQPNLSILKMSLDGDLLYYNLSANKVYKSAYVTNPEYEYNPMDSTAKVVFPINIANHWFYVVRLGNDRTLAFDPETKQWYRWNSSGEDIWEPSYGFNWLVGGKNIPIVGSGYSGQLYTLDPEQNYDEVPEPVSTDPQYFERTISSQVLQQGRKALPCYTVNATGRTDWEGENGLIDLQYSDDFGETWQSAGTVDALSSDWTWRSLGSIKAPGRLFRIYDTGALTSLIDLEFNSEQS